jgi:hypothetical protein
MSCPKTGESATNAAAAATTTPPPTSAPTTSSGDPKTNLGDQHEKDETKEGEIDNFEDEIDDQHEEEETFNAGATVTSGDQQGREKEEEEDQTDDNTSVSHEGHKQAFAKRQFSSSIDLLRNAVVYIAALCVCLAVAVPATAIGAIIGAAILLTHRRRSNSMARAAPMMASMTHSSRWMELRDICKRLDTHAWRIIWANVPRSSVKDIIEFSQIMPFFLMKFMFMYSHHKFFRYCFVFCIICDDRCAPLFRGIRDNVVFLDIVWDEKWAKDAETNEPIMGLFMINSKDAFDAFIVSCDWCSFVNGTFITVVQNIEADPELLVLLEPYMEWVADIVKARCLESAIDPKHIPTVPPEYSKQYMPFLRFIAANRTMLDDLETRWCPFKRAKSAYFRNTDPRFQPLEPDVVLQVGRILATQRNIVCDECPDIVNGATEFAHDPARVSLIQPMLDFIGGVAQGTATPR